MEPISGEKKTRVSEKAARARMGLAWSYPLLGFAAVGILLAAYLCQRAQIVSAQYTLVELRGEYRQLERQQDDLELRIQELTSLERVEEEATQRLGMVVPDERELLEIVPAQAGVKKQLAVHRPYPVAAPARRTDY